MSEQNCPICLSNSRCASKLHVMKNNVGLYCCSHCALGFISPMPSENDISDYYGSKPYFRYENRIEKKNAQLQSQWLHKHLRALNSGPDEYEFIEIGAGDGFLLNEMRALGYKVNGYEADLDSVKRAKEMFDIDISHSFFTTETFLQIKSDRKIIFALSHVLEHLHDPMAFLKTLRSNFQGALLFIEVPDGQFELPAKIACRAPSTSLNEHLWQFTTTGFTKMVERFTMQIVKMSVVGNKKFYDYHNTIWRSYGSINEIVEKINRNELSLFGIWFSLTKLSIKYAWSWTKLRLSAAIFGSISRLDLPSIRVLIRL